MPTLRVTAASPASHVVVPARRASEENVCCPPTANRRYGNAPGMSRAEPTITSVLPQLLAEHAVIVALPAALPVTTPAVTLTIAAALLVQVALLVRSVGWGLEPNCRNLSGNCLAIPSRSGSAGRVVNAAKTWTAQSADNPSMVAVMVASPAATARTTPAETVATPAADVVHDAANVASRNEPSLIRSSSRLSADWPAGMDRPSSGLQSSCAAAGAAMVIVTGADCTLAPSSSTAVAMSVIVPPAAAAEPAVTVKLPVSVVADPVTLFGAPTVPLPVAASESCVILPPPSFHPAADAVSDCPGCSVAPAPGTLIAACEALTLIAGDDTADADTTTCALASVPEAPLVAMNVPLDTAVNGTWKTALEPPAIDAAGPFPETAAVASPLFCTVTATSMAPPTCTSDGVATTDVTVRLAGFCTVAGPAVAGPAETGMAAFASVPPTEAANVSEPLPVTL